ncbi:Arsenate reductase (plasmid) [Rhodococcus sp. WAY2]|nr:Arsenate reductase [Rhodococcus sp. WAY2]
MPTTPSVLFVCVHNAGRSQMAAGFLTHLAGDQVEVRSAGSAPAETINSAAVQAMAEIGIDISNQSPKILTPDAVETSDVVITMGCGDACPVFPGVSYRDWALEDPAGRRRRGPPDPRRHQSPGRGADRRTRPRHRLSDGGETMSRPSVLFVCVKNGGKGWVRQLPANRTVSL